MTTQPVSLAALLRLDARDRAGLEWLRRANWRFCTHNQKGGQP